MYQSIGSSVILSKIPKNERKVVKTKVVKKILYYKKKIHHLFISFDFAYHESVSGSRILALNMELRFDYPDARIGFSFWSNFW